MRFLALALLITCSMHAADSAPDPAAVQAAMDLMSKTGPEHAILAKAVGEWDVQSTMWMAPGAPPTVSKASATFTSVLDGRWIRQDFQGEMMGRPYVGQGMNGYDTLEKQYVTTWYDNISTPFTAMTGSSPDGGKTITYTSEMKHCPMTGGPIAMRHVLAWESADRMVYTMFSTPRGGSEQKGMELVYTRKKAK
jgi:hypothetical protein